MVAVSNVARALDVEAPDELAAWMEASELDEKVVRSGGEEVGAGIARGVLERVLRIRGLGGRR